MRALIIFLPEIHSKEWFGRAARSIERWHEENSSRPRNNVPVNFSTSVTRQFFPVEQLFTERGGEYIFWDSLLIIVAMQRDFFLSHTN